MTVPGSQSEGACAEAIGKKRYLPKGFNHALNQPRANFSAHKPAIRSHFCLPIPNLD